MTSSILAPPYQPPMMHSYGAHPPPPPPPQRFIASSAPRYAGVTHAQNSAQSAANPDEDWTKISDLAERRRIQNRIAQRNYRKKLKRRLEDLERRASSTSPQPANGALPSQHDLKRRPSKPGHGQMAPKRSPNPNNGAFGSAAPNDYLYAQRRDSRNPSLTPPPSLAYSPGSATTSPSMPSVFQNQAPPPQPSPYAPYSAPYSEGPYSQPILPPPAGLGLSRLPNASEPWQPAKPAYGEEEMFNQFGMNGQYPASTSGPYESSVGVSTGYPEQSIYSSQPLGY